jgi:hypothetical protein
VEAAGRRAARLKLLDGELLRKKCITSSTSSMHAHLYSVLCARLSTADCNTGLGLVAMSSSIKAPATAQRKTQAHSTRAMCVCAM